MGIRLPSNSTSVFVANVGAAGAEVVIAITPPLNIGLDFAQVFISWWFSVQIGAGTTSVGIRIRRGPLVTSPSVIGSVLGATAAAGSSQYYSGFAVDVPGAVAGQQYSLSMLGSATTGAFINGEIAFAAFML